MVGDQAPSQFSKQINPIWPPRLHEIIRAQFNYARGQFSVELNRYSGRECSLSIEKANELLSVASLNDVSCVCVTETWFKDFMSDESVGLSGYCCERKDRLGRAGGGVACYAAATVAYDQSCHIMDIVGLCSSKIMLPRMHFTKNRNSIFWTYHDCALSTRYINDFSEASSIIKFIMYADDTTLLSSLAYFGNDIETKEY